MTEDPHDVKIPTNLTFASHRQENEWQDPRLPAILREIVEDAANFAFEEFGWIPVITSIYRDYLENEEAQAKTTIHCVFRAIDIRTRNINQQWVESVGKYINGRWVYDANRPLIPVAYYAPHGTGPHIHFQSHYNSVKKQPAVEEA